MVHIIMWSLLGVSLSDGLTCAESLGCSILRDSVGGFDNSRLDMGVYD